MTRLLVHVEGETEETFVNEILAPHLYISGYEYVGARLLGNARQRSRRGGIRPWPSVRSDVIRHLSDDTDCLATTMVDYYALPRDGEGAWPGRAAAGSLAFEKKTPTIGTAIVADLKASAGEQIANRFIPFIIMHEFEALLFSDCGAFAEGIERRELAPQFQAIRNRYPSPEHINDSLATAPSKQIEQLVPGYQKPLMGNLAALKIGLQAMRGACPIFDGWLSELEKRPSAKYP